MEKREYVPPILEVFEFEVERGFANSMSTNMNQFIGDAKSESVLKGDTYHNNDSLWDKHEWY